MGLASGRLGLLYAGDPLRTHWLTLVLFLPLLDAVAGDPDFEAAWREQTCSDQVILAAASSRVSTACGDRAVFSSSVSYRPLSGARGCEVWLTVQCASPVDTPYTGPGNPSVPTLYTDENFGGTALALGPGRYNLGELQLREGPDTWNDKAGSVRIPEGWTMRLCSEADGNGKCADLQSEHPKLGSTYVGNDSASFVEVAKGGLAPLLSCPRVFEHDGFGGTYLDVCNDVSSWNGTPWNDRVSSLQVPAGWTVQVCTDAEYGGTCVDLRADTRFLRDTPVGADKATSLRITARPR